GAGLGPLHPHRVMERAPALVGALVSSGDGFERQQQVIAPCSCCPLRPEARRLCCLSERIAMLNGPLLVTERLILRPPAAEDFGAFAEMCSEEETMRFIGGACPRAQAWRLWCTLAGAWH